jgi:hypothetical protein
LKHYETNFLNISLPFPRVIINAITFCSYYYAGNDSGQRIRVGRVILILKKEGRKNKQYILPSSVFPFVWHMTFLLLYKSLPLGPFLILEDVPRFPGKEYPSKKKIKMQALWNKKAIRGAY